MPDGRGRGSRDGGCGLISCRDESGRRPFLLLCSLLSSPLALCPHSKSSSRYRYRPGRLSPLFSPRVVQTGVRDGSHGRLCSLRRSRPLAVAAAIADRLPRPRRFLLPSCCSLPAAPVRATRRDTNPSPQGSGPPGHDCEERRGRGVATGPHRPPPLSSSCPLLPSTRTDDGRPSSRRRSSLIVIRPRRRRGSALRAGKQRWALSHGGDTSAGRKERSQQLAEPAARHLGIISGRGHQTGCGGGDQSDTGCEWPSLTLILPPALPSSEHQEHPMSTSAPVSSALVLRS